MTRPTVPPDEQPTAQSRHAPPRRLPFRLPEPVRRLGHIAHLLTLGLGMILLALWQNTAPPASRDGNVTFTALVLLYIAVALHMAQGLKDLPPAAGSTPPSRPQAARKRGRPRAIPSGHSEEAARQKYQRLRELRSQGATWQEAARAVNLSVRQAQHLAKHFPEYLAERGE
ncbi:MAG TPA: hypothetical protein VFL91_21620 [Thermomicrobiales bacterium]|nr:hypothetical protein [Thermomicrobiales bacterium]